MAITHASWTSEDKTAGIEAFRRCNNNPKGFVEIYNTLRPDRPRSAAALYHRLVYWAADFVPSVEFVDGLRRIRGRRTVDKRASSTSSSMPVVKIDRTRWLTAGECAKRTGYSDGWVRYQHTKYQRVERIQANGSYYYNIEQLEEILKDTSPDPVGTAPQTSEAPQTTDGEVLRLLQRKLITPERAAEILNQRPVGTR